jgi:hypothetical protein
MATIFKRGGKGNWIVQFFNSEGRRVERSSRTTDKRAAERMAREIWQFTPVGSAAGRARGSEKLSELMDAKQPVSLHPFRTSVPCSRS